MIHSFRKHPRLEIGLNVQGGGYFYATVINRSPLPISNISLEFKIPHTGTDEYWPCFEAKGDKPDRFSLRPQEGKQFFFVPMFAGENCNHDPNRIKSNAEMTWRGLRKIQLVAAHSDLGKHPASMEQIEQWKWRMICECKHATNQWALDGVVDVAPSCCK